MSDSFPQQFGPYVLIRVLGVGGMGDVYFALTGKPGMEKPCVVKRLAQHSTSEDGVRFRREANLARKLSHGAIVQTIAVDEIDGELVIAQEFLHGCKSRQSSRNLSPPARAPSPRARRPHRS